MEFLHTDEPVPLKLPSAAAIFGSFGNKSKADINVSGFNEKAEGLKYTGEAPEDKNKRRCALIVTLESETIDWKSRPEVSVSSRFLWARL